jgi:hypothetical protein
MLAVTEEMSAAADEYLQYRGRAALQRRVNAPNQFGLQPQRSF